MGVLRLSAGAAGLLKLSRTMILFAAMGGAANLSAADLAGDAPAPATHVSQRILIEHPGEKIDLFSGQLRLNHVDFEIPGNGGLPLRVERTYKSRVADLHEPVGLNWSMHFGRLKAGLVGAGVCATNYSSSYSFELPNGDVHTFYRPKAGVAGISSGVAVVPAYLSMTLWRLDCLTSNSDLGFAVTSPDGLRYEFTADRGTSPDGQVYLYPSKIIDKFGNYLQLAYVKTPSGKPNLAPNYPLISTVTASDGRKLTFAYNANYLVSSVTADDGRQWTYVYQLQQLAPTAGTSKYYQLTSVTRPDGATYTFSYHVPTKVYALTDPAGAPMGQVKTVKYPWGGTVTYDYTYTSTVGGYLSAYYARVLKSKTTSDGGTWTFSFALSKASGTNDVTTVNTPDKTIVAKHYGYQSALSLPRRWHHNLINNLRGSHRPKVW